MPVSASTEGPARLEQLEHDPRWLLLQRIVHSDTMRRANHLRRMLTFVTEFGILHPENQLREHEIACGVLGRKDDFDPAYDNIVRVQASHLRRKLSEYFADEGADEPLVLTIPKGGYVPIFEPNLAQKQPLVVVVNEAPAEAFVKEEIHESLLPTVATSRRKRTWWYGGAFLLVAILIAGGLSLRKNSKAAIDSPQTGAAASQIFPYMLQHGNKVSVVLPDTSLLMLQKILDSEISIETYSNSSFPTNLVAETDDPRLRKALLFIGSVRTTTLNEAVVGMDFLQMLSQAGLQGEIRYARDLRIRELGEGNYVLIGNQRSNPAVSLFANRMNFRFADNGDKQNNFFNGDKQSYYFQNLHPRPGESERYTPYFSQREAINYVDITLTPNLSESGYVLIISGSDVPANEAAARFLLRGKFPPAIQAELRKRDLRTLEILLRGHHLHGESNDEIGIVTFRSETR